MEFQTFLTKILLFNIVDRNLHFDGIAAQLKMTPKERLHFDLTKIKDAKKAAVLALFYPNVTNETCFLLTLRANYKGAHASQISFPGGKKKLNESLQDAALRETQEEVGINSKNIKLIKSLNKTYIPPSNFLVTPYIGILKKTPLFVKNYEVKELLEIKLKDLFEDTNLTTKTLSTSYMNAVSVPCFKFGSHIVWGATAMILNEIKELFTYTFD